MANLYTPRANLFARATLVLLLLIPVCLGGWGVAWMRSSYRTGVGVDIEQPVPFSHQHHVAGLGIDCRYCHTTVETSAFAGMPTTDTCMNCHRSLWTDAELLEPVRQSWRSGVPVKWQRVHSVPDYVYFDHSIHVTKGIGCVTCHGRVDQMPLVRKTQTLYMQWCLDCHRDPSRFVRPVDLVFDMRPREELTAMLGDVAGAVGEQWTALPEMDGVELMKRNGIVLHGLTDCSMCHR